MAYNLLHSNNNNHHNDIRTQTRKHIAYTALNECIFVKLKLLLGLMKSFNRFELQLWHREKLHQWALSYIQLAIGVKNPTTS